MMLLLLLTDALLSWQVRYTDAEEGALESMVLLNYAGWSANVGLFGRRGGGCSSFASTSLFLKKVRRDAAPVFSFDAAPEAAPDAAPDADLDAEKGADCAAKGGPVVPWSLLKRLLMEKDRY